MDDNFKSEWVDFSGTKFNLVSVYEYKGSKDTVTYTCRYDIDVKFKNVSSGDKYVDSLLNKNIMHKKDSISKTYDKNYLRDDLDENGRPKWLFTKNIITKEDVKEDTVEDAIDYFLKTSKINTQLQFIADLFGVDIPQVVYLDAVQKSKYEFSNSRKLKTIEYNHSKMQIDKITVVYEDGESFTVQLPKPISNRDVGLVIPGSTLPSLYNDMDKWLKEDYDSTVKLLSEIFGFDVETMKGAEII